MKIIEPIDTDAAIAQVKNYLLTLQKELCNTLENEDEKKKFTEDGWQHAEGGGGISKTLTNGAVIEKAGVNFSHVFGRQLPQAATKRFSALIHASFQALGVSAVVHPKNPYVPASHFNVRFIFIENKPSPYWWFGGGFDLTPYYGFEEDCIHWHQTAKKACEPFGKEVYSTYKKWADDYFYLKHRNEPRGIGGLFFDDLNDWGFKRSFDFMKSIGAHYMKAYQPIVAKRKNMPYTEQERAFQLLRRGRYVEFNLLYDRGTLFGLQSGGRVESILMSLPPMVTWDHAFEMGKEEAAFYDLFLKHRDWV